MFNRKAHTHTHGTFCTPIRRYPFGIVIVTISHVPERVSVGIRRTCIIYTVHYPRPFEVENIARSDVVAFEFFFALRKTVTRKCSRRFFACSSYTVRHAVTVCTKGRPSWFGKRVGVFFSKTSSFNGEIRDFRAPSGPTRN